MSRTVEGTGDQPPNDDPAVGSAEVSPETTVETKEDPFSEGFDVMPARVGPVPPVTGPSRRLRRSQLRKTRVEVRRVGPISVLKLSVIFYFCLMLIVYGGLLILYGIMSATGAIDKTAEIIGNIGFADSTGKFQINGNWLFTRLFVIGCGMVLVAAIINLLVAFLYNLLSDLLGGLEVTLSEKR